MHSTITRARYGFSPLRYGDSIVGRKRYDSSLVFDHAYRVFSPLRYGDSIVGDRGVLVHVLDPKAWVSVPFAMGTAL